MRVRTFRQTIGIAAFVALAAGAGCGRGADQKTREGYDLIVAGKIDEAIAFANAVLADDPNHAGALNVIGLAYYKTGDLPGALGPLQKAVEIDPKYPEARFNLGNVYQAMGRPQEAEAEFSAAVELQDKFVLARYNLGKIYEESARADQAIAQYRRVVDLDPQFFYAHMDLGKFAEDAGDFEGAIANYSRALELQPTIKELRVRLGNAHFKSATPEGMKRAEQEYRASVGIDSLYVDGLYSLGVLLASENRTEEATPWFRRALLASGPDADTQITRQIRRFFAQLGIPVEGSIDPVAPGTGTPAEAAGDSAAAATPS